MRHHSGSSTETGSHHQRPAVNLDALKIPKDPAGQLQRRINDTINKLVETVTFDVSNELIADGNKKANELAFWHSGNKEKSLEAMAVLLEGYKGTTIEEKSKPPLLDYSSLQVPLDIDKKELAVECERQKQRAIEMAVDKAISDTMSDLRRDAEQERRKILEANKDKSFKDFTKADIEEWIGCARVDKAQQGLAEDIGLNRSPASLKAHRTLLLGAFWGAHATAGALIYAWGAKEASPYVAAFTCANLVLQCWGGMKFTDKTKVLYERAFQATKEAPDMEAAVFWTGQLFKLIKEHNPLFLAKNRTDLLNSEKATQLQTVARHLQEAADYGGKRIREDVAKNPMGFTQKDIVMNGFLDKAKADLDAFIARWNAPASDHTAFSAWTATISSLPWIMPLVSKIL